MTKNGAYRANRFFARKWLIILLLSVVLTVFGRIVDNKSLAQSAIVIGIGIDYADGLFTVSTQSVNVTGTAATGGATENYLTYTEKAKTISEAVDEIGQKTGLTVSLSHCNVVILSKSVLYVPPEDLFNALSLALSMPEQSVLVVADDVLSVLTARVPTTVNMPFFTQTTLLENMGSDGMARVTMKDYLAERLSRSGTVNIPFVDVLPMESQPLSAEKSPDDSVKLSLNRNVVASRNLPFVLDKEHAKAAQLYLSNKTKDKLSASLPGGGEIEFRILKRDMEVKVSGTDVKSKLKFDVYFLEAQGVEARDCTSPAVAEGAAILAEKLKREIGECFEISKEQSADILRLQNTVYRKLGRSFPEDGLGSITFSLEVQIDVRGNG